MSPYFSFLLNYFPFNLYNKIQILICSKISAILPIPYTLLKAKIMNLVMYANPNSKIIQILKKLNVSSAMGHQLKTVQSVEEPNLSHSNIPWLDF